MVKLQHDQNDQFKLTLPKPIMLALRWQKGDDIDIEIGPRGDIILRKKPET